MRHGNEAQGFADSLGLGSYGIDVQLVSIDQRVARTLNTDLATGTAHLNRFHGMGAHVNPD